MRRWALAAACAFSLASCGTREAQRSNLVLIIVDTLRADKLGCYGFGENTTPELDRLARQGVLFRSTLAQCPWTRPSIASMLTSLYPRSLGIYHEEEDALAASHRTLAEILQAHGYKTIGLTANPNLNRAYNFQQGFDVYRDSLVVFRWMDQDVGRLTAGARHLRPARDMFSEVLELAASRGGRPHYVQLTLMEMHEYYKPGPHSLVRPEFEGMFPGRRDREYLRSLRQVSHDIGEFVGRLAALPGWRDTLFVVVSDHGEGLGDHPDVWKAHRHGRQLYETQIMVPLILYHPGGKLPARSIEQRVRLLDLMPTLLDLLGIPIPEEAHGKSLMGLITGEDAGPSLPDLFVVETQFRGTDKIGVYSPEWKYFEHRDTEAVHKGGGGEGVDPVELHAVGAIENGKSNNLLEGREALAGPLRRHLRDWESRFARAEPTRRGVDLTPEEREQLRSLGYVD